MDVRSSWILVIGESDSLTDVDLVVNRHSLANIGVTLNLALRADHGSALDRYECRDARIVSDAATVEIRERVYDDILVARLRAKSWAHSMSRSCVASPRVCRKSSWSRWRGRAR